MTHFKLFSLGACKAAGRGLLLLVGALLRLLFSHDRHTEIKTPLNLIMSRVFGCKIVAELVRSLIFHNMAVRSAQSSLSVCLILRPQPTVAYRAETPYHVYHQHYGVT
jgi:hypothetical protein